MFADESAERGSGTLHYSVKMEIPADFPAPLQELLKQELAAGNEIVEIGHTFPAPPVGAWAMLRDKVAAQRRKSGNGISFYERNNSSYCGEFADERRFFFVLEPPCPDDSYPDMNAIREKYAHAYSTPVIPTREEAAELDPDNVVRFRKSMVIDYEKWHDGIGYDLDAYRQALPDEQFRIEQIILNRGVTDWRDVEALSIMKSDRARAALQEASRSSDSKVRMAVLRYAPEFVPERVRVNSLLTAIRTADIYEGLTEALDEIQDFHPPEIIDALKRGVLEREGGIAVHFAAMLMYLHGKAKEPFDWSLRPWFLKFNTDDKKERKALHKELIERIES